jgi:hypothetical protein
MLASVAALSHLSVKIFVKSVLGEGAVCAMVIKQQNMFIPIMLKCNKGNMAKVWLYNPQTSCFFERIVN